jgi:DNA-binding HxlR family transcriptional regulator
MAKRKTLGSTQEKIVNYLAENPGKTMSEIQQNFDIPKNSYNIIHRSANVLEEMGYIFREVASSEKERPTYPLTLTEKGVFYAVSKSTYSNKIKILKKYESLYPNFEKLLELNDRLGEKITTKLFNNLFSSLQLFDERNSRDEAIQLGSVLAVNVDMEFTDKERKQVMKAVFEMYPEFIKKLEDAIRETLNLE